MSAELFIQEQWAREFRRLSLWCANWLTTPDANHVAANAFYLLWYEASTGTSTSHGAYARLYELAEPTVRHRLETRGRVLPLGCKELIELPSDMDMCNVSQAFALVALAAEECELDFGGRMAVARAIQRTWPGGQVDPKYGWTDDDEARLQNALETLTAGLQGHDPQCVGSECTSARLWELEDHRAARWRKKHAERVRRYQDGQDNEDHNQGEPGAQVRDDLVERCGVVRQSEPGSDLGAAQQ